MKRIVLYGTVAFLLCGCSSQQGAVLVDQTRQAAVPLVAHEDPEVSSRAQDIALNSQTLLATDYAGKLPPNAPAYTPAASKKAREEAVEAHETGQGLWGILKSAVKALPGGEWCVTGLMALWGIWQTVRKNKWAKFGVSTAKAVQEAKEEDKDWWEGFKDVFSKAHIRAGVADLAEKVVNKVKGKK